MVRCRAAIPKLLIFTFPFHFTPCKALWVEEGDDAVVEEARSSEGEEGVWSTGGEGDTPPPPPPPPPSFLPLDSREVGEGREGGGRCEADGPEPKIDVHREWDASGVFVAVVVVVVVSRGVVWSMSFTSPLPRVSEGDVEEKAGRKDGMEGTLSVSAGTAWSVVVTPWGLSSGDTDGEGGGNKREESEEGEMGGGRRECSGAGRPTVAGGGGGDGVPFQESSERAGGMAAEAPPAGFTCTFAGVPPTVWNTLVEERRTRERLRDSLAEDALPCVDIPW